MKISLWLSLVLLAPAAVFSFVTPQLCPSQATKTSPNTCSGPLRAGEQQIQVDTTLSDDRVTELYAWVSRALAGDPNYGNLMVGIAAVFGDLPEDSVMKELLREAMATIPPEEKLVGEPLFLEDREQYSLGAMGAAQWTGRFKTRPHALLDVSELTSVDEWKKPLSRGVRRTLKKALAQNFTVTAKPIRGGEPAPHSSLAHFRCVVEHEVRLLDLQYGFIDALGEAISRYIGTCRMAGEIREYRDADGKVIAFAHEVRKGRTIRGQWFYSTDWASKNYVWFHSVHDLVERAIEADGVDVVDLGPSGSDAFSELKQKYGFVSVDDWPAVANYLGPFWYPECERTEEKKGGVLEALLDAIKGNDDP